MWQYWFNKLAAKRARTECAPKKQRRTNVKVIRFLQNCPDTLSGDVARIRQMLICWEDSYWWLVVYERPVDDDYGWTGPSNVPALFTGIIFCVYSTTHKIGFGVRVVLTLMSHMQNRLYYTDLPSLINGNWYIKACIYSMGPKQSIVQIGWILGELMYRLAWWWIWMDRFGRAR